MSFEYVTEYEEKVCVPTAMEPFKQLGISSSASAFDTKFAFLKEMVKPTRQERAMASLAYHMITSTGQQYEKKGSIYELKSPDIFFFAAIGHSNKVSAIIEEDPQLANSVDDCRRTIVYLAARSGFSDIVETLVRKGADVNSRQRDNSTPLHAAAFYEQKHIVGMLLVYGADPALKNSHEHTPVQEASEEVKEVFAEYENSPFKFTVNFFRSYYASEMKTISYRGRNIGAEVFRSDRLLDKFTYSYWNDIQHDWEVAYHGTKQKHIKSILTYGLLPSGAKLPNGEIITPPSNHFSIETTHAGVEDWPKAIFVSPSIMYASHPCYSEHVHHGDSQWCVVLKVLVNPSSYKAYDSTVSFKEPPVEGEPKGTEYRVEDTVESKVFRVWADTANKETEVSRNVVVASVIFMDLTFRREVRDFALSHDDLREIFR